MCHGHVQLCVNPKAVLQVLLRTLFVQSRKMLLQAPVFRGGVNAVQLLPWRRCHTPLAMVKSGTGSPCGFGAIVLPSLPLLSAKWQSERLPRREKNGRRQTFEDYRWKFTASQSRDKLIKKFLHTLMPKPCQ